MGKHHRHGWKAILSSEPFRGSPTDLERQLAEPGSHRTIEPDRDAAGSLTEQEEHQRRAVHTDREPTDDFHLAAQRAGQSEAHPVPAGIRDARAPEADR